ncbi:box A-binding factor isoform X2 [Drosophila elegans]|uniref:box A-binding factor isoform X2 n=1 Tax=Drosophila elegans TaxID=30023 RepID=UPI0007E84A04|nr:box A-binding factor isoform X2 [Drosophila elegans]
MAMASGSVNKQYSTNELEAFIKIATNWQNSNHNLLEGVDLKTEMTQYMNSPSMNMYKKRERTQNWNHQEKKYLLDLCRKDMRIIENKRLDAGLTAVKNKAWKIIHQKFSNQFGTDRTCNRLKEQWRRMKACTRNEILDYNNRLARFGAEVADRKKPSPFTFEVWDFMQEAKKACKSEALDGIDYSKIPLALEEGFEYRDDYKFNVDEHDMDDSSRTPPQELCDVDIKEEENNETFNETFNNHHLNQSDIHGGGERLSVSPNHSISRNGIHEADSPATAISAAAGLDTSAAYLPGGGADMTSFPGNFNMNNISATLEALNALRSGQFPSAAAAAAAAMHQQAQVAMHHQHNTNNNSNNNNNINNNNNEDDEDGMKPLAKRQRTSSGSVLGSDDQPSTLAATLPSVASDSQALERSSSSSNNGVAIAGTATSTSANSMGGGSNNNFELRMFMEMQSKEHMMRMKILEVQLQAAKHSRDLVEINKTLALQKLQELASKRLPS